MKNINAKRIKSPGKFVGIENFYLPRRRITMGLMGLQNQSATLQKGRPYANISHVGISTRKEIRINLELWDLSSFNCGIGGCHEALILSREELSNLVPVGSGSVYPSQWFRLVSLPIPKKEAASREDRRCRGKKKRKCTKSRNQFLLRVPSASAYVAWAVWWSSYCIICSF